MDFQGILMLNSSIVPYNTSISMLFRKKKFFEISKFFSVISPINEKIKMKKLLNRKEMLH